HDVRLVGTHLDRDVIDSIKNTGVHPNLDVKLSPSVRPYQLEDAEEAFRGAEIAMSGVNSFGVRWASQQLPRLLQPGMHVIAVTKGMDAKGQGEGNGRYRAHNYEAVLFAQGSTEIGHMLRLLGGRVVTAYGLPGVGDMYVTAAGGRNVRVGRLIGTGLTYSEAHERLGRDVT